jgi:hypothetical protein
LPSEAVSASAENRVQSLVGQGYLAKPFRLGSIAFLGLRLDELTPGYCMTVENSPSHRQMKVGWRIFASEKIQGARCNLRFDGDEPPGL